MGVELDRLTVERLYEVRPDLVEALRRRGFVAGLRKGLADSLSLTLEQVRERLWQLEAHGETWCAPGTDAEPVGLDQQDIDIEGAPEPCDAATGAEPLDPKFRAGYCKGLRDSLCIPRELVLQALARAPSDPCLEMQAAAANPSPAEGFAPFVTDTEFDEAFRKGPREVLALAYRIRRRFGKRNAPAQEMEAER